MCFWFKNHDKNINAINEFKSVFPEHFSWFNLNRKHIYYISRIIILYTKYLPKKIMEVKDSNGNILNSGDAVMVIKTLKVKRMSSDLKVGTVEKYSINQ
jgi:hypothetical protein